MTGYSILALLQYEIISAGEERKLITCKQFKTNS